MGRSGEYWSSARDSAEAAKHGRSMPDEDHPERKRILDAMVETVAERGYAGTEIDEVIARAQVSRQDFNALFTGKEDCFVAMISDNTLQLVRAVESAWQPDTSWPERVRLGLNAFVGALVTDPTRTRITMVESGTAGPAAAQEVRAGYQRFVPYFDAGRDQVSFDLPAPTADAIVGGIALTVQRQVAEGDIPGLWALLPDLVYFALVPYLGHRRASALAVG